MNIGGNDIINAGELATNSELEQLKKELQLQRWIIIALAVVVLMKN